MCAVHRQEGNVWPDGNSYGGSLNMVPVGAIPAVQRISATSCDVLPISCSQAPGRSVGSQCNLMGQPRKSFPGQRRGGGCHRILLMVKAELGLKNYTADLDGAKYVVFRVDDHDRFGSGDSN